MSTTSHDVPATAATSTRTPARASRRTCASTSARRPGARPRGGPRPLRPAPGQRRAPGDGRRLPGPHRHLGALRVRRHRLGRPALADAAPLAGGRRGRPAGGRADRPPPGGLRDATRPQACSASQSARARAAMSGLSENSPSTPASRNARDSAYRSPGAFGSVPTRKFGRHELVLPAQRPHVHDQAGGVGVVDHASTGRPWLPDASRGSTQFLAAPTPSAYVAIVRRPGSGDHRGVRRAGQVGRAAGGVDELGEVHVDHRVELAQVGDLEGLDDHLVVGVVHLALRQRGDQRLLEGEADGVEVGRVLGLRVDADALAPRQLEHLVERRDRGSRRRTPCCRGARRAAARRPAASGAPW